ncbi:MAG: hypothetical protein ISP51_02625 [Flavobacteriaceae bacterium]|nr:hypothetical protein [Flavobacteriaceae bacterium]
MFRKLSFYFSFVLLVALSTSCEPKMTLQRYFYQAQENGDFMLIDLPTSLLGQSLDNLNDHQRETLLSVRKVSALIYSDASKADFIKQQQSVINEFLERDVSFRLIAEKNDFDKTWFLQPLLKYNPNPFTIFFIGGSTGYSLVDPMSTDYQTNSNQIYLKFQYMFDL